MIDPSFELSLGDSNLPLRSLLEALVKPLIDAALAAERFDLCLNLVAGAIPEEAPQPSEEASAAAVKRLEAFIAQQ